jgi:hypothetical protein
MLVERSLKDAGATESKTVLKAFDELTADKLAELQTNAKTVIDALIATIPEDYTKLTAKVNGSANAIKGRLSGAVVSADDVSPVEHLLNVNVHGKNLCVLTNAITYPSKLSYDEATQTFTIKGSALIQHIRTFDKPFPVGTKVAVTLQIESGQLTGALSLGGYHLDTDGTKNWQGHITVDSGVDLTGKTYTKTFTSTDTITDIVLFVDGAATINTPIVMKVQFELGNTATEYTPYVDPSTTTISAGGETYTPNADGTVTGISSTVLADGISANTEGMIVECEYNKDTNKVVQKLADALGITI